MQSYSEMTVVKKWYTIKPGMLCKLACDHTMVAEPEADKEASVKLLKFLIEAEHTSVLEHCVITFEIKGVSRSLMAQLTRHRVGSFTCQSQHYQDYSDVPAIVANSVVDNPELSKAIIGAYKAYERLQLQGVPKEEARQVLPNAAAVNILWTVNARSLMGFLRQRMCKRNVNEMRIFAIRVHDEAYKWWPELFMLSGAPCMVEGGKCNQGKMMAEECKCK